jgi:anti-sigma factor RsiW
MQREGESCREIQDRLPSVLTGEEGAAEQARVLRHLAECAACRVEGDRITGLIGSLGSSAVVPDPGAEYWESFLPRLRNRIAREGAARPARRGAWSFRYGALAASVAVFFLAATAVGSWEPPRESLPRLAWNRVAAEASLEDLRTAFEETASPLNAAGFASDLPASLPGAAELERALETLLPEEDDEMFTMLNELRPEEKRRLVRAILRERG